jgi:hypothetical protein
MAMPSLHDAKGRKMKRILAIAGLAGAMALTGCSDGLELQGGVFDALGVSGTGDKPKLADVKVPARPGLVLPPNQDKLPEPVTGSLAAAPDGEAWPVDPEDRKAQSRADLEKRQADFCDRALLDQRMRHETGVVMGPAGNCRPGMFGSLSKGL